MNKQTQITPQARISLLNAVQNFRSLNLRPKIFIAFIVVSLISVGILSIVTNTIVRRDLTRSVGGNLKSIANAQANSIADQLSTQVDILSALGLSKTITDKIKLANTEYDPTASNIQDEILQLDQQWRAADEANNDSDPLVQSHLNSLLASQLRTFRATNPDHLEVFVTDRYGALLAATNRTSDYYQADEDWWKASFNDGQGAVYIGQPEFDDSVAAISYIMVVPLYDPNTGEVIGILRSTLLAKFLARSLELANFGNSGQADLLFPNGQDLDWTGNFEENDPNSLAQLHKLEGQDYGELFYEGENKLVSQADVISRRPDAGEFINNLNWKVIANQGSAEALQTVNNSVRTGLFTSLGVILLAGLISVYVAQTLVRPIDNLTATAKKILDGDLNAQAAVTTKDEIGTLAATFNSMTAQLRETLAGLEQRVADRTKDLEAVAEVGTATATILKVDQLLQAVVDLTQERFNLYHSHIYLLDEEGENLVLASGAGEAGRQMMAEGRSIPLNREQSLVARAAREQVGITVNDVTEAPDFLPNPLLPDTRSELAVPMVVGGKVIGVFDVQSDIVGRFTDSDIQIQTTLAAQLATSVQNVRTFEQSNIQADFELLVNTIGQKIQRATTVEDTLQVAVRELGGALGATRVRATVGMKPQNGGGSASN